jgi:ATP-binding cassette subfamily C protein
MPFPRVAATATARTLAAFVRDLHATMGRRLLLAVALIVFGSVVEGSTILLLMPVLAALGLDRSGSDAGGAALFERLGIGAVPSLEVALGVFVAAACAQALLLRWQSRITYDLEHAYVARWRTRLYKALTEAPWTFLVERRPSDLAHTLATDLQKAGIAAYQVMSLATAASLTVVYLAVALWISPALTAAAGLLAVAPLALARRGLRRSTSGGERVVAANAAVHHAALEHLSSVKTSRSYGAEARNAAIFDSLATEVVAANTQLIGDHASERATVQVASAFVLALLVLAAAKLLALPAPQVLVLLLVFVRLMPRIGALHSGALSLVSQLPAFTKAALLERTAAAARTTQPSSRRSLEFRRGVAVEGVSFSYPGNSRLALDGVSMTIARGATIGIAGASGSGKTTLADVLLGLLTPSAGRVRVDDVELAAETLDDWRRRIGYVSQDTFLFDDTIRANLTWALPGAGEADLWSALRTAAAERFVRALPSGLDTVLGDRGVRLSGGERQRLALARAFLRQPQLLVLDEATSALDAENEQAILEALTAARGRITVVLITHRLSLLKDADVIYVLEEGRMVESGTWAGLGAAAGRLAALARAQGVD